MADQEGQLKPLRVRFGFDSPLDRLMYEAAPYMRRALLVGMAEDCMRFEATGGVVPLDSAQLPKGNSKKLIGKSFFVTLDINGDGLLSNYLRSELGRGDANVAYLVRQLAQRSLAITHQMRAITPVRSTGARHAAPPVHQPVRESTSTSERVGYHEEVILKAPDADRPLLAVGGL